MKSISKFEKKCPDLLAKYYKRYKKTGPPAGEFLIFDTGHDIHRITAPFKDQIRELLSADLTIYNPTKPIEHHGKKYLIGRVEPRHSEESKVMFFEEYDGVWKIVDEAPVLGLQDPFHVDDVQGWHVVGGVRIFSMPGTPEETNYETVFYRYKDSILELFCENGEIIEPFAVGPLQMKDIRLIDLENGKIAVFTRPQGDGGGLGKIGYTEISNLDKLGEKIPMARIIENQFGTDEWGGANELHLLKNGKIGVLGHIAHFDESNVRHYYAMAFVFNPKSRRATHMEILTTADEFPSVKPKKSDMGRVIFSGGLHRNSDGTANLYVGVGDVRAGRIKINDPFLKYEKI